ncbi:hypothetical protein [Nocardia amikacinitolerans]|nr:hypothetical protein [Nocardia amikacinitolerans]
MEQAVELDERLWMTGTALVVVASKLVSRCLSRLLRGRGCLGVVFGAGPVRMGWWRPMVAWGCMRFGPWDWRHGTFTFCPSCLSVPGPSNLNFSVSATHSETRAAEPCGQCVIEFFVDPEMKAARDQSGSDRIPLLGLAALSWPRSDGRLGAEQPTLAMASAQYG